MSSSNKNVVLKKVPPLPSGWVAYPSKSYPNRVYYYNMVTGCSSWDEPKPRQHRRSGDEQCGKKLTDFVSKSDTSSVEMASHKPCELTLTSDLDKRLRSNASYSSVLSLKSHEMTLTRSKRYERHRMKHDPTFPYVKDCKRINNKTNTNVKMSVPDGTLSFDGAECKYHNSQRTCEEAVCRKRRMKKRSSRSDSAAERLPSKQIKLHHDAGCQNSSGSVTEVLRSSKKNSQVVLPSTLRGSSSSASGSSEVHLQKGDAQRILKDKTQKKISLEHAAVNTGLHNAKRKCDLQDCDSGLAARRLNALQTKLAEELMNKGTSGGQESEELPQKIRKSGNPSRSSSGTSEIGIPVVSCQTSQKESSLLKNDGSTLTHHPNLERTVPDPCQRTYLKKGFEKSNAAKRMEALQKKLAVEHDRDCKELTVQKGNSPLKTHYVPESCAKGDRTPSSYLSTHGSNISDKEIFHHNLKQNLSGQCPDLTGHMMTGEDELMEWEPIEDDKILSHIQEVRIQIQHDDKGIQKLDYGVSPIFFANGKQEWFIVLDSNILLSNIKYIEELRDTNVKGLGFPVLVIPWQVLQELDVLKDQGKVKNHLLAARARRAISFLHSNFTSKHPRVRGQTALDAISKDFKIEVPDDAILHCCLQIAQKTNQMILLSNDKNLCNKAIVNGVRAYKMAEIQQALQEWGTECSAGNVLMDVIAVDKAASLVDSVQCRLKSLLKELLSRVLENEMIKAYDTSWKQIVVIKPPWTLSDILICMRKHWIGVFGFVMPAEAKLILDSLSGFFGNITQTKGYEHSLPDVKAVLQQSLHLCMLIRSENYRELASRCFMDIEVLQNHCEEALSALTKTSKEEKHKSAVKNEAQHKDIQSVTDVLKECWDSVHLFCAVMCDVLGFEHHEVYNRPQIFPTPDAIREKLPYYCHSIHALIKNIMRIRELPMSVLTVDHEAVKHFCLTLTNLLPSDEVEEKINPQLILEFCTTESTRSILGTAQAMFQEIGAILDRGMNYFVQCGTC